MAESWKQAKIYVASGYFDMEGERQQIFNSVLPEIRKACVLLRVQVHFVDLRVGVNEHDWWLLIDKGGFEPILLEIDRCAPFFVGIYGEKYGRMVEDYKFPRDPTWNKIREGFPPGRSLLELETYWGALRDPRRSSPVFCFRDPAFLKSQKFKQEAPMFCSAEISPPLTSRYPERKTDLSIGATFLPESKEAANKMASLKALIRKTFPPNLICEYTCTYLGPVAQFPMVGQLQALTDHVIKNLFMHLQTHFPANSLAADMLETEASYHKAVLDHHLEHRFVGRKEEADAVLQHCIDSNEEGDDLYETAPLIVHGRSGSGVSCVLSNVVDLYRDRLDLRKDVVMYHFVKASTRSSNVRLLLGRLCATIIQRFDFTFVLPQDFPSLTTAFKLLIDHATKTRGNKIVIFLDGLDQLDAEYHGDMLHWLPHTSFARIVLGLQTGSSSYVSMHRRYRGKMKEVDLADLSPQACIEILAERMFKEHKTLSVRQTNMLLSKKEGRRPLFLQLAASEVMVFGRGSDHISMQGSMDEFVQGIAETTRGLCRQTFMRWAEDFPENIYGPMVKDVLTLIASAKHGLLENEILDLVPREDPRMFEGAGVSHPPVPLPPLLFAQLTVRLAPFLRSSPRQLVRNLQFQQYAMLRAIQKYYFPDSSEASQLWVKLYTFAMVRDRAQKFAAMGSAGSVELVADALKNVTARNAEEKCHSRHAKFFREKELKQGTVRSLWGGQYPRALAALPYHLTMSRGWSALEEVLLDLRFIEGKFRQRMGYDLLQDFVLAVQTKAPEAAKSGKWGEGHKRIQDVHRFCAQNFDRLAKQPSLTFQLAANHPDASTLAKIALEQWRSGAVRQPWVRWLNKPAEVDPLIITMEGHTGPITRAVFTSDGLRILTGSEDASMRLWDAFSGEVIGTIRGHLLPVLGCVFVPGHSSGENLRGVVQSADWSALSASRDKSIKMWDLQSGQLLRTYKGHVGRVLCIAIKAYTEYREGEDPIKMTLVASGSWDRSCKIWDLESGELLHDLGGPEESNTSPNSNGHLNAVTGVSFSPDGSVIATGSDDETMRLWNVLTGEELKSYQGHDNGITSVDYSANGEYVLTASQDGTLKMWDTADKGGAEQSFFDKQINSWVKLRSELATFVGNQDRVQEGRISRDMQVVVSACRDGTVRVFNATISSMMRADRKRGANVEVAPSISLYGHVGAVRSVSISPDSWRVVSAGDDGTVRIWDLGGTGTPVKQGHLGTCTGCSIGAYGEYAVSCGMDGVVKYWNAREGLPLKDAVKKDIVFQRLMISPDGLRVAAACEDGLLRVYDLERGEAVVTQRHSHMPVRAVAYSNTHGFNICTGADDGTVKFWTADKGELKGCIPAHVRESGGISAVNSVAYDATNMKLLTTSEDRSVKMWLRVYTKKQGSKDVVKYGESAAGGRSDEEQREIKRKRLVGQKRKEKEAELGDEERLSRRKRKEKERKQKIAEQQALVAQGEDPDTFSSSDEESLLDENDLVQIEDALDEDDEDLGTMQTEAMAAQEWILSSVIKEHDAPVMRAIFSDDASRVFSCSKDGTIRMWTAQFLDRGLIDEVLAVGDPVPPIPNTCLVCIQVRAGPIYDLALSTDGSVLAAACGGDSTSTRGVVTLWDARSATRVGSFDTQSAAVSCAMSGFGPYDLHCGDADGHFYMCRYGSVEPAVPKPTRTINPPLRPSGMCAIL